MTVNQSDEKTIRSEVAEELDCVAGFPETRIEEIWDEGHVPEVGFFPGSWACDLRTGAEHQRDKAETL